MLKGYLAKSKVFCLECAICYKRIYIESKCVCEDTQELINSLKDKTLWEEIYAMNDLKKGLPKQTFTKEFSKLDSLFKKLMIFSYALCLRGLHRINEGRR